MFIQGAIIAVDGYARLISKLSRLIDHSDDQVQNLGESIYRRTIQRVMRSLSATDDMLLVVRRRLEESQREKSELSLREQTLRSEFEQRANEKE